MEAERAELKLKPESFSNLKALKLEKAESTKFQVSSHLYISCFKRDYKSFWRQGKPVFIRENEVLISNYALKVEERESAAIENLKVPAKMLACFINERLPICLSSNLPTHIYEWPELHLKVDSPLAQSLSHLGFNLAMFGNIVTKQNHLCQLLHSLFQSLDPELFKILNRLKGLKPSSRQELMQKVRLVNEYMLQNLAEDLSLESLSDFIGYSHYHFQRQYKLAMGISPTRKLSLLRLEKAQKLINNTDYRLKEIAGLVGYNDLPTFSKAYKRYYGESPTFAR